MTMPVSRLNLNRYCLIFSDRTVSRGIMSTIILVFFWQAALFRTENLCSLLLNINTSHQGNQMPHPEIDCVLRIAAQIGESPIWSGADQSLYWVDITAGLLHRFDPVSGRNTTWEMGQEIGCFALCDSGDIIVALTSGFHQFNPVTGDMTPIPGPVPGEQGHRFNDGTVDAAGRFYAGTMPLGGPTVQDASGTLYCLNADLSVTRVMTGFHTINGMAFSPDARTVYISDSFPDAQAIWAYDYDLDDGKWSNKRLFFDTNTVPGRPDGGAVDSDGCYWMAGVSGWHVLRITPDGHIDMDIAMPVEKPTRIAFGGPDLTTIYVTSISTGLTPGTVQPDAGGIFAFSVPGVSGVAFPKMQR